MMTRITTVADELLISQTLVDKDLAKFRLNKHCRDSVQSENRRSTRGYLKLQFHDKGIEMVNPPRILNSKPVADTIPSFLSHKEPPIVTRTLILQNLFFFNFKQCIQNLDFDVVTNNMSCNCGNFIYMDKSIGHVLTGSLSIIKERNSESLYRGDHLIGNK
jgi:hypothetical protein